MITPTPPPPPAAGRPIGRPACVLGQPLCRGAVLRTCGRQFSAGDARWDASRQAYNLTLEQEPLLIAFPVDSADVQVLVSYAAERGIEVAPQRTGHNAEPLGSLGDVILVKTDAMRGVEIDASTRTR